MSQNIIKKGFSGAVAVFISRIFGLIRDMLLARFVGGGAIMSAWIIAFRVPNTFRRFFGEGASSQALIPLINGFVDSKGLDVAKTSFGVISLFLGIILAILSIIIGTSSFLLAGYFHNILRVYAALIILPILMPYTIFICLTGICSAILNLFDYFFLPALTAVLLNIFIIIPLLVFNSLSPFNLIVAVSLSVLLSGIIQLIAVLLLLKQVGFLPSFKLVNFLKDSSVKDFIKLAIPGFIGASVSQVNIMVDSFVALYIGSYAAPALYYSERIIYLPLGIFAVSIGNASLVTLTKLFTKKKRIEFQKSILYGINQILYITVALTAFILIFRSEIIYLIFAGDKFGIKEVRETAWAMLFYSFGISAFAAIKVLVSGFYAKKDMKTPLKVALICIAINLILNLSLMNFLQQGGIALATTVSSILNCMILGYILFKSDRPLLLSNLLKPQLKIVIAAIISGLISYLLFQLLLTIYFFEVYDWRGLIKLVCSGLLFSIVYTGMLIILKSAEQKEWLSLVKRKTK